MNAVWNSYGQLCGCPEIFKKSCKFFCRELDIRVPQIMQTDSLYACFLYTSYNLMFHIRLCKPEHSFIWHNPI